MKLLPFNITIYLLSITSYAQSEVDFITSYNKHIDPTGKLNEIALVSMQVKTDINYILNSTTRQLKKLQNCNYYSDGRTKCSDIDNNNQNFEFPNIPEEDGGNAVRTQLNFIKIKENDVLSFKLQSDSITVVEREITPLHKYLYTFDSKTKDLLQIKRVNQVVGKETYISYTDFKSYQKIDGILVPKNITFSNSFSLANLEYSSIEFK